MEVCLVGLFFLVRNAQDKVACAPQGIIMAVVLVLTVLYQIWIMNHLGPLFKYAPVRLDVESKALLENYEEERRTDSGKTEGTLEGTDADLTEENKGALELSDTAHHNKDLETSTRPESSELRPPMRQRHSSIRSQDLQAQQRSDAASAERILARLNQPLDEARLADLETKLYQHQGGGVAHTLLPRRKDIEAQMLDDPISKIIMQHNDELENLDEEERDMLVSVAFMHPVLRETRPCVWIPGDGEGNAEGVKGVSDDEIRRMRGYDGLVVDNRGAYFDAKGKVVVDRPPPDMSEFALIMGEL